MSTKTPGDTLKGYRYGIRKLTQSENRGILGRFSSTAQQRVNESRYAAYLQDTGSGLSSVKIPAQSVQ